jgi:uncharacterized membrane protein
MEYQNRVADQEGTDPEKTKRLEHFMNTLRDSADSLHTQSFATSGLALLPPKEYSQAANRDLINTVNIELRLLVPKKRPEKVLELYARYSKSGNTTHTYEEEILRALALERMVEPN